MCPSNTFFHGIFSELIHTLTSSPIKQSAQWSIVETSFLSEERCSGALGDNICTVLAQSFVEINSLDHQLQVCGRDTGSGTCERLVEHEPAAKATKALDVWI